MAEPSRPPDASPKPGEPSLDLLEHPNGARLHRRMKHVRVAKVHLVSLILTIGAVLAFTGVLLLASLGWALIVLSALLLAVAVAAYRTLEDE